MSDEDGFGRPKENVTFKEKYSEVDTWQEKAVLISLYHTAMCLRYKSWTQDDTAQHFGVSRGLVSENIRLAQAIDLPGIGPKLMKCETREKGLKLIDRRGASRYKL